MIHQRAHVRSKGINIKIFESPQKCSLRLDNQLIQLFAVLPTSSAQKSTMKLSSLLLVPSLLLAPVITARSAGEWVGDLMRITEQYRAVQTGVKAAASRGLHNDDGYGGHGEAFFLANALRKSGLELNAAVSKQQKASGSQLVPASGAESEVSLTFPLHIQVYACA